MYTNPYQLYIEAAGNVMRCFFLIPDDPMIVQQCIIEFLLNSIGITCHQAMGITVYHICLT